MDVNLCTILIQAFFELRPAFSRLRTAQWACLTVLGFCIRSDDSGVTSFIRAFGLKPSSYQALIDSFHSHAVKLEDLNQLWLRLCLKMFKPVTANGRIVLACDGIKAPKEGRRMPSVKLCHQSSTNNSKPDFVMAHSIQMLALMVEGLGGKITSVLIGARIHEGLVFSNRDERTLLDKMSSMFHSITSGAHHGYLLVADAYYASAKLFDSMILNGSTMLVRVKHNVVGYYPITKRKVAGRGRPKKYGKKLRLWNLFENRAKDFIEIDSPIRDEKHIKIRYLVIDLMWKQLQGKVRFILSDHPTRGRCIFMTNDWELSPAEAIRIYNARFGIELSFKAYVHTIGGFGYHFWMKAMTKIKRGTGVQYLHKTSDEYRCKVREKMHAYHVFINLAAIAQGLLNYLAFAKTDQVWSTFGGWMRTIRRDIAPSEAVTSEALKKAHLEFIRSKEDPLSFKKFLSEKMECAIELERCRYCA